MILFPIEEISSSGKNAILSCLYSWLKTPTSREFAVCSIANSEVCRRIVFERTILPKKQCTLKHVLNFVASEVTGKFELSCYQMDTLMISQSPMIETPSQIQIRNTLLEKLSREERETLFPSMELTEFSTKELVYAPRQQLNFAYFPETSVMSLITVLEDGSEIEAATIGNEGMIGIPLILASNQMPCKVVCQIAGSAWRISADELVKALDAHPALFLSLRKYAQALFDLLAQSTACNRLHTIEQRCARWLLSTHDRIEGDTFFLTHEFLATMLGVRRPGVSLVAKSLQDSGMVSYKHGKMTIRDRSGLEGISCECYAAVRSSYGKLA